MKPKNALCGFSIAVVLQLGMLAGSAQTNIYLYSGSETNITLNPGTYIITAYGAPGALPSLIYIAQDSGGNGAEMSAEFNFATPTPLILLVGGGGDYGAGEDYGGGGGGGSFVVEGSIPLVIAGGGGGTDGPDQGNNGNNGNVSTNGGNCYEGPGVGYGGGGTDGGGGAGGVLGSPAGGGGGGGGGFLGNGTNGTGNGGYGVGGSSFENGGYGGNGNDGGGNGGYGGGGGGGGSESGFYGGGGGGGGYSGGAGGHAGSGYDGRDDGGGGSIIDSSPIAVLAEVSGILSPDDPANGEIIIIAVPTPLLITTHAAFGFTNGVFGFNVIGPSGSNVVIQASTDLQTWVPLQTNLLGSGPLYFSDAQSTTNVHRFYRVQLSP